MSFIQGYTLLHISYDKFVERKVAFLHSWLNSYWQGEFSQKVTRYEGRLSGKFHIEL